MHQQLPAHHAITAADAERPGDRSRTSRHRPAVRDRLSTALIRAVRKKPECLGGAGRTTTAVMVP